MSDTIVANSQAGLTAKTVLTAEDSQNLSGSLLPSGDASVIGWIRRKTLILNNAQIKALSHPTPIAFGIAPASGFRVKPLNASWHINTTAGAYSHLNATYCALAIYYLGDFTQWAQMPIVDDVTSPASTHLTNFLAIAGNKVVDTFPYADWWGGQWVLPNIQQASSMDGIDLAIAGDNNGDGDFTNGHANNTLKVTLYYILEPL